MLFNETDLQNKLNAVSKHFEEELKKIRTGKPTPEAFEKVVVDYYGVPTALPSGVAQVVIQDATTAVVKVNVRNDRNLCANVEKALIEAAMGNVNQKEPGVFYITFRPITEEDRKSKVKEVHDLLEQKRVNARLIRQDFMKDVKEMDGVSEDEQKSSEKKIQEMLDKSIKQLEEIAQKKEKELVTI